MPFSLEATSKVAEDKLSAFVNSPLSEDVTSVPNIGKVTAQNLAEVGVNTTYQLIGKFLSFREPGMKTQAHCDAFHAWLRSEVGVKAGASPITLCVAEKANVMIPGIYNVAELDLGAAAGGGSE